MRKKVVLWMVTAALVMTASGCGNTTKEDGSQKTESSATSREEEAEATSDSGEAINSPATEGETEQTEPETEDNSSDSSEKEASEQEPEKEDTAKQESKEVDLHEEILDRICKDCANIGEGVSGITLKRTQQAYAVANYAAEGGFGEEAAAKLTEALQKRYDAMDDEEKLSFDGTFQDGIIPMLDQAILNDDFESIKAQFDDVGEMEAMEELLNVSGLKKSWQAVKKAYQKLNR